MTPFDEVPCSIKQRLEMIGNAQIQHDLLVRNNDHTDKVK